MSGGTGMGGSAVQALPPVLFQLNSLAETVDRLVSRADALDSALAAVLRPGEPTEVASVPEATPSTGESEVSSRIRNEIYRLDGVLTNLSRLEGRVEV